MSIINNLNLITTEKRTVMPPIMQRRNKLLAKLQEQINLCEAKRKQENYSPKILKTITNKVTGERMTVETVKRIKEWFWIAENGKINLVIKYGSKTLPLNKKGANAIELTNGTELMGTLLKLKDAVINGEFDESISELSKKFKSGFKK